MPVIALDAWDSAIIKTNTSVLLSRGMINKYNTYVNYTTCKKVVSFYEKEDLRPTGCLYLLHL